MSDWEAGFTSRRLTWAANSYEAANRTASVATDALRAAVRAAVAAGMSESEASRQAGVSRMTVRAWLGK